MRDDKNLRNMFSIKYKKENKKTKKCMRDVQGFF